MENQTQFVCDLMTQLLSEDSWVWVRSAIALHRSILPDIWRYLWVDSLEDLSSLPDVAIFGTQKFDKTLYYSVADIEALSSRAQLTPYGAYQMIIIDHAESMSVTAANKLLKLLEDIPLGTIFVLLSDEYDSLLPTIRSRVRYYSLQAPEVIADHSDHIVSQALEAYLRWDLAVYYDLMVNGLKKIDSPREEYAEVFRFLLHRYHHSSRLAWVYLSAYRDIRETNLPLRGVLDGVMGGLIVG